MTDRVLMCNGILRRRLSSWMRQYISTPRPRHCTIRSIKLYSRDTTIVAQAHYFIPSFSVMKRTIRSLKHSPPPSKHYMSQIPRPRSALCTRGSPCRHIRHEHSKSLVVKNMSIQRHAMQYAYSLPVQSLTTSWLSSLIALISHLSSLISRPNTSHHITSHKRPPTTTNITLIIIIPHPFSKPSPMDLSKNLPTTLSLSPSRNINSRSRIHHPRIPQPRRLRPR